MRYVKAQPSADDSEVSHFDFTLLSWNVLADSWVPEGGSTAAVRERLRWSNRCHLILQQLESLDADIMSLQEVELNAYEEHIYPFLRSLGYRGRLSLVNTGVGVAIFWRSTAFRLLSVMEANLATPYHSRWFDYMAASFTAAQRKRYFSSPNRSALLLALQPRLRRATPQRQSRDAGLGTGGVEAGGGGHAVIVATAHLPYYSPSHPRGLDVQGFHTMGVLEAIGAVAEDLLHSHGTGLGLSAIFAGDLNAPQHYLGSAKVRLRRTIDDCDALASKAESSGGEGDEDPTCESKARAGGCLRDRFTIAHCGHSCESVAGVSLERRLAVLRRHLTDDPVDATLEEERERFSLNRNVEDLPQEDQEKRRNELVRTTSAVFFEAAVWRAHQMT